jgi:hypothetical protein
MWLRDFWYILKFFDPEDGCSTSLRKVCRRRHMSEDSSSSTPRREDASDLTFIGTLFFPAFVIQDNSKDWIEMCSVLRS